MGFDQDSADMLYRMNYEKALAQAEAEAAKAAATVRVEKPTDDSQIVHTFDGMPLTVGVLNGRPTAAMQQAAFNPGGGVYSPNQIPTQGLLPVLEPTLGTGTPMLPVDNTNTGLLLLAAAGIALYFLSRRKK